MFPFLKTTKNGRKPVENILKMSILQNKVAFFKGSVVFRGNNNANANGGVGYANANIGSRLANKTNIIIGVQHQGCIPTVVPRGTSLSNSNKVGKLKN